jgi:hypothetical protein
VAPKWWPLVSIHPKWPIFGTYILLISDQVTPMAKPEGR